MPQITRRQDRHAWEDRKRFCLCLATQQLSLERTSWGKFSGNLKKLRERMCWRVAALAVFAFLSPSLKWKSPAEYVLSTLRPLCFYHACTPFAEDASPANCIWAPVSPAQRVMLFMCWPTDWSRCRSTWCWCANGTQRMTSHLPHSVRLTQRPKRKTPCTARPVP